jgi:hypothetical protein
MEKSKICGPQVEGRLMAMLEDVPDLTLEFLNEATQAWASSSITAKSTPRPGKHRWPAGWRAPM